jgi:hypothetical protein
MMLMFDRGSRKSLNYLLSRFRRPIKGRASKQDAVMAKARPVPGHRTAETNGLVGQTAKRALREVPNRHCKPQCDCPASVQAMPRRDGERARQSSLPTLFSTLLPTLFPPLHAGGSPA